MHHFRTREWDLARRHLDDGPAGTADFASRTWLLKDLRTLLAAAGGDEELLATGETRAVPGDGPRLELAARERQIAEPAASGLTNREMGARLHRRTGTVGSPLHHVSPKLGITPGPRCGTPSTARSRAGP